MIPGGPIPGPPRDLPDIPFPFQAGDSSASSSHPRTVVVIPARFASTRFPGKLLAPIHGKSVLAHVIERARLIRGCDQLLVATDDSRIAEEVRRCGADVRMTSPDHSSGTDRIGEVVASLAPSPEIVLNLQGDEPLLRPRVIERLLESVWGAPDAIWTLAEPIADAAEFAAASVVKVVCAGDGRALYFSRAPIPFDREATGGLPSRVAALRHVGVYAYPTHLLREFLLRPPSLLETTENLEQLRGLEAGIPFRVLPEAWPEVGIDTPEDLERLLVRYPTAEDLAAVE